MFKEKDLALVIRDLGNERLNTPKKLVPVRPKAALGIRKKKKKRIAIAKPFALHANA